MLFEGAVMSIIKTPSLIILMAFFLVSCGKKGTLEAPISQQNIPTLEAPVDEEAQPQSEDKSFILDKIL